MLADEVIWNRVTGTVAARLQGECGRCLEQFAEPLELQLTELFVYPDSTTDRTTRHSEEREDGSDHDRRNPENPQDMDSKDESQHE